MRSLFPLCLASILKVQIVTWDTWTILDVFSVDCADEKEGKTAWEKDYGSRFYVATHLLSNVLDRCDPPHS